MPRSTPLQFVPVPAVDPDPSAVALCRGGEVVDLKEAGRRLCVSRQTLYRLMDSRRLGYVSDGRGCRRTIPVREIERYLSERFKPATE